jgi:hypothetical protein
MATTGASCSLLSFSLRSPLSSPLSSHKEGPARGHRAPHHTATEVIVASYCRLIGNQPLYLHPPLAGAIIRTISIHVPLPIPLPRLSQQRDTLRRVSLWWSGMPAYIAQSSSGVPKPNACGSVRHHYHLSPTTTTPGTCHAGVKIFATVLRRVTHPQPALLGLVPIPLPAMRSRGGRIEACCTTLDRSSVPSQSRPPTFTDTDFYPSMPFCPQDVLPRPTSRVGAWRTP